MRPGPVPMSITTASLMQNYPNPFNPSTTIEYFVPDGGPRPVSLVVYNVRGSRVRTLVATHQAGGRYAVDWDGLNDKNRQVSSGIYFYRLATTGFSSTKKMILLK